jgi:GT2 family glycosyltransferase
MTIDLTLSASLVLYRNRPEVFEPAIRSYLDGFDLGLLYVIDNSEKPLASPLFSHPRVCYQFAGRNLGFGAGHNLALTAIAKLESRRFDAHLIMNPDVCFGDQVLPTLMAGMAADASIGALMPKIEYPDGRLQRLCKLLPTPADLFLRRFLPLPALVNFLNARFELHHLPQNCHSDVPSISGCFLFVRSTVLRQVEGFDERFFMYMEDLDLVRRIGELSRTVYMPEVCVSHAYAKGSYRNRKLLWYHLRSACQYFNKWGWFFDSKRRLLNRRTLEALRCGPGPAAVGRPLRGSE